MALHPLDLYLGKGYIMSKYGSSLALLTLLLLLERGCERRAGHIVLLYFFLFLMDFACLIYQPFLCTPLVSSPLNLTIRLLSGYL